MISLASVFITLVLGWFAIRLSDVIYHCKRIATRLYLLIYKRRKNNRLDIYDSLVEGQPEKLGFILHPVEIELESPCSESHLARANDKIFIYGVNSKKEFLLVTVSRFYNGKAEAVVSLRLANGKTYHLEKNLDFQQSVGDKRVFSCGGLQMYYLSPMRRWRIFFSGFLKETSSESPNAHRMAYVKFSFLWRASSDVYDNTADMKDSNIIDSVTKVEWKSVVPPINRLYSALDFYAQAGIVTGTVFVEDSLENYEMYLFGERMRFLGDASMIPETEFSILSGFVHRNGTYILLGDFCAARTVKNIAFGFVVRPNAVIKNIERCDIFERTIGTGDMEEIKGSVLAGRQYAFCGSVVRSIFQMCTTEKSIKMSEIRFHLDGREGTGIYIEGKNFGVRSNEVLDLLPPTVVSEFLFPMVVAFTEDLCQQSEITGGKGSSLGKLTRLSTELKTFVVPTGMVVTTSSYKTFISSDIQGEIKFLESVLYGNIKGDVKDACKRVYQKIVSSKISTNIRDNIVKNLKKIFGEKYSEKKFAVRSSATGEDTEQMSAAGQMDTFLGVTGLSNIILALKKCWASQFSFTAVQYKRHHGQILNTPMAVVIQEMVQCDVAGVLFTCDPVIGNPTKMSIAANFGLGESVVSGSEEPDIIELKRDYKDELKIHQVTVGAKSRKIILTDDGTELDDISESDRSLCCLSPEIALSLGKLAIAVEKKYRSRQDIEWGIQNDVLYIFQSRPVTTGTEETDFEIEHEFNGPLRIENEYYSVCNMGEVIPGAMTPFGLDVFIKLLRIVMLKITGNIWMTGQVHKYFPMGWNTVQNHAMFDVIDMFPKSNQGERSNIEKATMVAFFGRIIDDDELFQMASERYCENEEINKWLELCFIAKLMFFSSRRLKKAKKLYANYRIPVEKYATSKDMLNVMSERCCDLTEAFISHMFCSQGSTIWNMLILVTLSDFKGDIDDCVYSDFADLATNKGDVESADVPAAMQSLAFHISKSIDPKEFKEMETEEAVNWLKTTSSSAGVKFAEFISKHGHRCLKEFDTYSIPWGTNPKPLVQLLQNLACCVSEDAVDVKHAGILKSIAQLKVPLGLLGKLKLLLLVPLCRKAIRDRESSKSLAVKGVDAWRKGHRALAKLMVSEGRIPNEDIMYFMTLDEIKELIETRSPKILAKAYHRQRLYPKMDGYIYSEIIKGFPRPINENVPDVNPDEDLFLMKGIPVSQGTAKGYVRVALNLNDATGLKPGEILLAYSTDIGWTPYFPTLAGVATELGGLISHGAVVSREYGLPCVAGLHGATRRFKTGDYVLLDGNTGILQKLQAADEQQ